MSNYVDLKYINILSVRQNNLNRKVRICSTSDVRTVAILRKIKLKQEGICMPSRMTCFINVITVVSVTNMPNFIKDRDQKLYSEYCLEKFKKKPKKEEVDFKPKFDKVIATPDIGMKISDLDDTHPAKKFVLDRKIPRDKLDLLYFCDKFMTLVNRVKQVHLKILIKIILD